MARFYYDAILGLVFWSFNQQKAEYNYSRDSNRWIGFDNGKRKMKLRQYIQVRAEHIHKISMGKSLELKSIFIEAYNLEGIEGVNKIYNHTLKRLVKSVENQSNGKKNRIRAFFGRRTR